jgi:hypothetical protein
MTVFQGCAVHYVIFVHLSVVIKPICTLSIFICIFTFRIGRVPLKYVGKSEVELLSGKALLGLWGILLRCLSNHVKAVVFLVIQEV